MRSTWEARSSITSIKPKSINRGRLNPGRNSRRCSCRLRQSLRGRWQSARADRRPIPTAANSARQPECRGSAMLEQRPKQRLRPLGAFPSNGERDVGVAFCVEACRRLSSINYYPHPNYLYCHPPILTTPPACGEQFVPAIVRLYLPSVSVFHSWCYRNWGIAGA